MKQPWRAPKTLAVKEQETVAWPDRGLGYAPPALASAVDIDFDRLSISIARNLALRSARAGVVDSLYHNARRMLRTFVDARYNELRLLADVDDLADQAVVTLAHDVAVGIAGLSMEDVGFIWRDHAKRQLAKVRRRPDYVWATGHYSGGVALSEVKGAASAKIAFGEVSSRTRKGFHRQLDDWKLDSTNFGDPILAGYAIGVHVPGGRDGGISIVRSTPTTTSAPRPAGGLVPRSIALGHYAAAFTMLGATGAALQLLDQRYSLLPPPPPVRFEVASADGIEFVVRSVGMPFQNTFAMLPEAFEYAAALTRGYKRSGDASEDSLDRSRLEQPPAFPGLEELPLKFRDAVRAIAPDGIALVNVRRFGRRKVIAEWVPDQGIVL